jgi:hypothetical protein
MDRRQLIGDRQPVGPVWVEPSSSSCFSPATRISKNSSRLLDEMHRNFSRSSSGTRGSRLCASTRWLNSSEDSSRLMNVCGAATGSSTKAGWAILWARTARFVAMEQPF